MCFVEVRKIFATLYRMIFKNGFLREFFFLIPTDFYKTEYR
ncbi:hypothetical protein LEP1GSC074_0009 [Leptospira noguchii str. Hook]|uniref:Uncharacterized protein n=1 Tax=Leptospira noguchii serovar Autumnalis str. ZUN142 TaxID=1085540 RepID=M6U3Q5_9LEPT|nr:hypothetical protein LEP1GSC186_2838 [Leptospira noguchii serovar Autumnalis str. ZUN142]EMS81918.1 hypothetical protein LEP1GSC074_0009 [Leptospira noguchii str. Hook]